MGERKGVSSDQLPCAVQGGKYVRVGMDGVEPFGRQYAESLASARTRCL